MDPDAPPLVQADWHAEHGLQLSAKRAFQQASEAHTQAAKNYHLAANATSDAAVAKLLLMQCNKQLKLSEDAKRSRPTAANTTPKEQRSNSHHSQSTRSKEAHRAAQPPRHQHLHNFAAATSPYRPPTASTYSPRYSSDASVMEESRISRRSTSPSQSVISTVPHSTESRGSSSVEESYYLLRNTEDPEDPMTAFLNTVDGLTLKFGNAVAFASVPVVPLNTPGANKLGHKHTVTPPKLDNQRAFAQTPHVQESFYVVPSNPKPQARVDASDASEIPFPPQTMQSSKTLEELIHENATLKDTLDDLSKRFEAVTQERTREREAIRGSVANLQKDLRRQAERAMVQSMANLSDNRRQVVPRPEAQAPVADDSSALLASQRRVLELSDELRLAKAEAEKATAQAQRYKTRLDELRKAILEKRKAKEKDAAAAAATSAIVTDAASPATAIATAQHAQTVTPG